MIVVNNRRRKKNLYRRRAHLPPSCMLLGRTFFDLKLAGMHGAAEERRACKRLCECLRRWFSEYLLVCLTPWDPPPPPPPAALQHCCYSSPLRPSAPALASSFWFDVTVTFCQGCVQWLQVFLMLRMTTTPPNFHQRLIFSECVFFSKRLSLSAWQPAAPPVWRAKTKIFRAEIQHVVFFVFVFFFGDNEQRKKKENCSVDTNLQ